MASSLVARIERAWYAPAGALAFWLAPLSFLYAAVVALRRHAYRAGWFKTYRARVPVVVIGNLTVGGTGKSPLVAWLVEQLAVRGVEAGILSRGYGGESKTAQFVTTDMPASRVGDEAVMHARRTSAKVVVAPRRSDGAKLLEQAGVDLIVCDDGLQHWALARDLEIVVIDAARGFGNGRLLPAGPLREAPARLAAVDFVVVQGARVDASGTDVPRVWQGWHGTFAMHLRQQDATPVAEGSSAAPRSLASFRGQRVHAVAGIGHPARFFAALRAAGLEPIEHAFRDHHAFTAGDLVFGDEAPVLMTCKDAVKCRSFADARCWQVPVEAELEPAAGRSLVDHVARLVRATQTN
ncbi:MAG: tetraacyldisaccharide 4'-kinase [Gammaproteobacteria bacterium]|nr:tetraacyldisaccharide 4'-kinase [Gammaproteobacteria bacterium]